MIFMLYIVGYYMAIPRRTLLTASGAALTVAVAGCLGDDDDGGNGGGNGGEVDDFLSDVANYDSIEDLTGESSVTVENGEVDGAGQQFVYEPAAIRIDEGTEVTWEWVGGDSHTVTHDGGEFDSDFIAGDGETWSYTFDEAGTYLYYCAPHQALEQKGAVVVE